MQITPQILEIRDKGQKLLSDYLGFDVDLRLVTNCKSDVLFAWSYHTKYKPIIDIDGSICTWMTPMPPDFVPPKDMPTIDKIQYLTIYVRGVLSPKTRRLNFRVMCLVSGFSDWSATIFTRTLAKFSLSVN